MGRLIEPGTRIGEIQTLGRWRPIVAPAGAWGRVESLDPGQERLSGGLGYGATLLRLNPDGVEARRQMAIAALDDVFDWVGQGGHIAIYDATNGTRARRDLVHKRCADQGLPVLFVESQLLYGSEGLFKLAISGVALIGEPFRFGSPVDIFFGLPEVFTSSGEAKGFKAH